MLILPQEVEMTLCNSTIKYYEDKGYEIPRYKNKKGKMVVKEGTKILVNVIDLPNQCNKRIEVICDYCGKQYYKAYNDHSKNNNDCCNNCRGIKTGLAKLKYTYNDVKNILENDGYYLIYQGDLNKFIYTHKDRVFYMCSEGHINEMTFHNYLQGHRCPDCAHIKFGDIWRIPFIEVKQYFKDNNCTLLTEEYKNDRQKLNYIAQCGHENIIDFTHFKDRGQGRKCRECKQKDINEQLRKYDYDFVKDYFESINYTLLSKEYLNIDDRLEYLCDHNHYSKTTFNNIFHIKSRCKECYKENNFGENHHNWNPNLTDEDRNDKRLYFDYMVWRIEVYKRDNYTCQCCGDNRGGNINAHHLDGYHWCKEKRTDINNGKTLCDNCHIDFHKKYGYKNNTKEQYKEWLLSKINIGGGDNI